jgi:hypothetical protein
MFKYIYYYTSTTIYKLRIQPMLLLFKLEVEHSIIIPIWLLYGYSMDVSVLFIIIEVKMYTYNVVYK